MKLTNQAPDTRLPAPIPSREDIDFDPVSSAVAVALYGLEGDWNRANPTPLDDLWTTCYHQANDLIPHVRLFVKGFNENQRQRIKLATGEEAVRYLADVLGMKELGPSWYAFRWKGFRHEIRQWRGWLFFSSFEEKSGG
jgi:hypothetical protein